MVLLLLAFLVGSAAADATAAGDWTLHRMTDAAAKTGAVCLVRAVPHFFAFFTSPVAAAPTGRQSSSVLPA